MTGDSAADAAGAVDVVYRQQRSAILATLIRLAGDIQLAEDALQESFAAALVAWPRDGVPDNPAAWIMTTARRRAIDRLRRDRAQAERVRRLVDRELLERQGHREDEMDAGRERGGGDEGSAVVDDRLRLIFTCCHPALDLPSRVALTLRLLGGLTTGEIARAFLVAEPTMGKRIVRAKRKIADAGIRYRVPADDELPGRLLAVLQVVYLIFNEGYSAAADGRLGRADLCEEAVRLGRLLSELMPDETEVWGLLALMLLHDARRAARTDRRGRFVALADQDRSAWDMDRIREGLAALRRADRPGEYQLQAAIAALHLQAADAEHADWAGIARLYAALSRFNASPVIAVNHAAAVGFADGPERGLALLKPLLEDPAMQHYQPLHAAHADLLSRAGDVAGAEAAYRRAEELAATDIERAELRRRRLALA